MRQIRPSQVLSRTRKPWPNLFSTGFSWASASGGARGLTAVRDLTSPMYICKCRRSEEEHLSAPTNAQNRSAGRAVDCDDAPAATHACALDMVDTRDREILN